ncbi:hypothetical protein PIIN_07510 [Serendipita indica DSM 11827]|uniref:Uncharacterized protein n=1 Tax=Serendipita indica (strain DSM 11827) TaxID=1109443 RepID=G4TQG4_SERID|nr:hypothetical protein PIIN_07510 [Serendipita indica DSM 11827]
MTHPGNYGLYPEYDDAHALGINPTNLLTQSNRTANGLSTGDAPTTVDPKMMSVASSAYPQYLPPTAAQFRPSSYQSTSNLAGYPPMLALSAMDSTLGDALDYEPTPETLSEQPSTPPTASTPPAPPAKPLIDQVKSLLTPKHLDKDPRGTAEKLFSLLIVSADQDKVSFVNTDKDTRMEVLTRIRDHAPKEFYTLYGKNLDALVLLRDWGKDAVKKEAYIETAMNWLQVVDKIPITVPMLVESGLGKIVKFLADRPPTRGEPLFHYLESFLRRLSLFGSTPSLLSSFATFVRALSPCPAREVSASTDMRGESAISTATTVFKGWRLWTLVFYVDSREKKKEKQNRFIPSPYARTSLILDEIEIQKRDNPNCYS